MKSFVVILAAILLTACSGGSPKELYETAKFEELQNNHLHAVELYTEIIDNHPESEYAGLSKERLSALKR
ncbi:MAG: hypothetical protein IMF07_08750 [Proteobacteria bacterium]|nr:hypothetical protein [Pseudomonadota bacterium]